MASQTTLHITLIMILLSSNNINPTKSDSSALPAFAFSWLNDVDTFSAGDTTTIKVIVLGKYEYEKYLFPFKPNITVNDKMGNSSYITGLNLNFDGGTENWTISFTPIMVGLFNVLITDEHFHVLDASLHFKVNPGQMYSAAGILSWKDATNEFTAGTKAEVLILPKDAFGNNVSLTSEGAKAYNSTLSASTAQGLSADLPSVTIKGLNQQGFLEIEFITVTAGDLLLHVEVENQKLHGSPIPFKVNPGELDIKSCVVQWNVTTKYFQLFSMMEGFINQHDRYGNMVTGHYEFDIEVIEKGTNLSMPEAGLSFKYVEPGIQMFSFSLQEPGDFILMISDREKNDIISNVPYEFTVFIGYCDGENSVINGSGLNNSVAGDIAEFSVFLKDAYLYPSPVQLEIVQVVILHDLDSEISHPSIRIRNTTIGGMNYGDIDLTQVASASEHDSNNSHKASDFDVIYKPEKSGIYKICVFCGNIPLNGGHSFKKEVIPGAVNVSLSGIVNYAHKVPKLIKNEVLVRLVDSYNNPVVSQQSNLRLEIASVNKSGFSIWPFLDNNNGSYTTTYQANEIGFYEMCASYNGERFIPFPVGVSVYNSEYFPKAYDDTVSVWEDESITFNVLENDYFAAGNATILEYSKPDHGSILQYRNIFRYTPYKGFYGNDTLSYTIVDVNGNRASGFVDVLVLCAPPQFISVPSNLQATEDTVSPTFLGFSGFKIIYSDPEEIISVTLSSKSGTILLSPIQMQYWQTWDGFSVQRVAEKAKDITVLGRTDAINFVLQYIQYFGNENFYGTDTIRVSTKNKNGRNDIDVPINVQPINDAPILTLPSFVLLHETSNGALIFRQNKDGLKFIEDPDLLHFPANRSRFLVMFSLEVSSGILSTNLPAELIGSTEVKLKNSYHWQPVVTFVTISKHFLVKAKGIRLRGSIDECNRILEQLSYHEGEHGGAVLTVTVNDLGNHGCYPDCNEMVSVSLSSESTVNLIWHRPMSSLAAHTLGSAVIIVSIVVFSLGMVLLFYMCKCAVVLVREKKKKKKKTTKDIELSAVQGSSATTPLTARQSTRNEEQSGACCQVPFLRRGQSSNSKRLLCKQAL